MLLSIKRLNYYQLTKYKLKSKHFKKKLIRLILNTTIKYYIFYNLVQVFMKQIISLYLNSKNISDG